MSFWRKVFGLKCLHVPEAGWCGSPPYGRVEPAGVDGLGTEHCNLFTECRLCGKEYVIAKFHVKLTPTQVLQQITDTNRKLVRVVSLANKLSKVVPQITIGHGFPISGTAERLKLEEAIADHFDLNKRALEED